MKRNLLVRRLFIFTALIIAGFTLAGQAFAETTVQTAPTATVNTGALNVRTGPSIAHESVTIAYEGYIVTLIGRNDAATWAKVRLTTGEEGWVNASLITPTVSIASLPVVAAPAPTPRALVATGALNVRSGPDVIYSVLTVASQGQTVSLIGRNATGSWAKIRTAAGQEGWANASLLDPNVPISGLPVVAAPAPPEPPVPVAPGAQLSLRATPSLSASVVGHVYQGQRVTAIGRNSANSWVKLRINETGLEGWISIGFVQLSVPLNSLPVLDGTAPPAPTPTPTPTGATAVIGTGALNVRSGPGIGYGVVTTVYQGNVVSLLGRNADGSWAKIRTAAGQAGWVNVNYITPNVAISSLPVLDAPTLTATGIVNTGALNVRAGPGINFTATAVVYQGTSLGLIGRTADSSWVKVQLSDGHAGWVNAAYIQTNVTISGLPVTQ